MVVMWVLTVAMLACAFVCVVLSIMVAVYSDVGPLVKTAASERAFRREKKYRAECIRRIEESE